MGKARELELIEKGTPCYIDYSDKNLLTVKQAQHALEDQSYICPNIEPCEDTKIPCTLRMGMQVARNVMKGSDLKKELYILAQQDFIDDEFWDIKDEKVERIKGRSNVLRVVEYFARVVLLPDISKSDLSNSVLSDCERCEGVKLEEKVYDSIWFKEGPGPCAGSGETRGRVVEYCPNCEKKPVGGIVYQEDIDKEDDFLRKLSNPKY